MAANVSEWLPVRGVSKMALLFVGLLSMLPIDGSLCEVQDYGAAAGRGLRPIPRSAATNPGILRLRILFSTLSASAKRRRREKAALLCRNPACQSYCLQQT
jgi:hypothetical protein